MSTCLLLPATFPLFLIFSPPFPEDKTRHMLIEIAAQLQKKSEKKKGGFQVFVDPVSTEGM